MRTKRIHVMGAPGSGTTTLGRALASALALPHHDTDDYYWRASDPPYQDARPVEERLRLAHELFLPRPGWVLSGSVDSWGPDVAAMLDLVIFLLVPTDVRLARLRVREARLFGDVAIAKGGWRHEEAEEFFDWASHYEDGTREGRSRALHEAWLGTLSCSIQRIDGTQPIEAIVADIARTPEVSAPALYTGQSDAPSP